MVAVILIVAITVVLAAVCYLLVSSLTRTVSAPPLGSEFAWGSPSNDTSIPTSGCASTTHYCYYVEMVVTAGGLPVTDISIALQNPAGSPVGWPTSITAAGGSVELIAPSSGSLAARYVPTNGTWQLQPSFSGGLTPGYSLAIYCGGAAEGANEGLWGLEIVAIGTRGYSGTVASTMFT